MLRGIRRNGDMKKTYEKPVLTTEQFDAQDVVTASSPAATGLDGRNANWEINTPPDIQFN